MHFQGFKPADGKSRNMRMAGLWKASGTLIIRAGFSRLRRLLRAAIRSGLGPPRINCCFVLRLARARDGHWARVALIMLSSACTASMPVSFADFFQLGNMLGPFSNSSHAAFSSYTPARHRAISSPRLCPHIIAGEMPRETKLHPLGVFKHEKIWNLLPASGLWFPDPFHP